MEANIHIQERKSPFIAAAIHDGHFIPPTFMAMMQLQEHERMREEDPYTAYMANLPVNTIRVDTSRFLVDLNRSRTHCIYRQPEDAWGLEVWNESMSKQKEEALLNYYDFFYTRLNTLIQQVIQSHGCFVVLDIHSYNHRRSNPDEEAPADENPEINIGTIHNLPKWKPLIKQFIDFLSQSNVKGHRPDVRENVKFKGGYFSKWICEHYGNAGCVLSIEFKKTFMDEWTGRVDIDHLLDIQLALKDSLAVLKTALQQTAAFTHIPH